MHRFSTDFLVISQSACSGYRSAI
uniref:Uncharacterized protein n=1 Tax=Anguilla anguilla TaxID=7936 RepID=A0A0E9XWQ8_ANGAN